jgi:parallel beta-helix repeat protein
MTTSCTMTRALRRHGRRADPIERLEPRLLLTTYSVTSAADAGAGTLRDAITLANARAGADVIQFQIGSGPQTIHLFTALPTVTSPLTLDGSTQPGFGGAPIIELDGANTAPGTPGLRISAGSSTVRGLVVNAFPGQGIWLEAVGGNRIEGNYIGTDRTGSVDRGNQLSGVYISASSDNTVGGTSPAQRNVISGNDANGIEVKGTFSASVKGTVIQGNLIGTTADGTAPLGNAAAGIDATSADDGQIGGAAPGARNVISANTERGIRLGSTGRWVIQGNYVGTDAAGSTFLAEQRIGVEIGFTSSDQGALIGGTTPAARNVIAAGNGSNSIHTFDGIFLSENARDTTIQGNYIGLNADGTAVLGKASYGIENRGPGTLIGGTTPGAGNVIGGFSTGISTFGYFNNGSVIQGNFIGTNPQGTTALPNSWGINVSGEGVLVGGTAAGAGNLVSGNTGYGIIAQGLPGVSIQGNRIGTNLAGTSALPNETGVYLIGSGHVLGGAAAGAGNLISGNTAEGVEVYGGITGGASAVRIEGNRIGTNQDGTTALGNGGPGVLIDAGPGSSVSASNVAVGGAAPGAGNLISANAAGIKIVGAGATGNTVLGNRIGTSADGLAPLGNTSHGVWITSSSFANAIGGVAAGAGNAIAFNGGDGIYVESGSTNTLRANSVFSNAGLGIDLGPNGVTPDDAGDGDTGANNLLNHPAPSTATASAGQVTVTGTYEGLSNATFVLDFYAGDDADPSGYGEGRTYLGSAAVTTDGDGNAGFSAALSASVPPGKVITATATDPAGSTSEFSRSLTVSAAGAPAVANVYLSGSQWQPTFRQFIAAQGLGSAEFGFAVGAGTAQLDEMSWSNLDRVSIRFGADAAVDAADLRILSAGGAAYALDAAAFTYEAATHTATWRLAAGRTFAADRILLDLNGVGFGAPADAAAAPGSDLLLRLNILPGDTNRSGAVLADDFSDMKRKFFRTTANPGTGAGAYSIFHDLNGSGSILADDFSEVKKRFFNQLPTPLPTAATAANASAKAYTCISPIILLPRPLFIYCKWRS